MGQEGLHKRKRDAEQGPPKEIQMRAEEKCVTERKGAQDAKPGSKREGRKGTRGKNETVTGGRKEGLGKKKPRYRRKSIKE